MRSGGGPGRGGGGGESSLAGFMRGDEAGSSYVGTNCSLALQVEAPGWILVQSVRVLP